MAVIRRWGEDDAEVQRVANALSYYYDGDAGNADDWIGGAAAALEATNLRGAVSDRDRWRDCARKLYAQWQAGERPPSESALGRIGFQMREPERGAVKDGEDE